MERVQNLYEVWTSSITDKAALEELASIRDNAGEIKDRFYRDLEFGTAGLRGILGLGTNRMNIYTVGRATQALAQYLLETCGAHQPSVAIAFDSRICSDEFSKHAASVLAANGIKVHLFAELMPTPILSYAVRALGCDSGIVITASHNPAVYNGYKAYNNSGCQIDEAQASKILEISDTIDPFTGVKTLHFQDALVKGLISYIPDTLVNEYLEKIEREAQNKDACAKAGLNLIYTPLNGTGRRTVCDILRRAGAANITIVPEQEMPDGNFPTCPYPNPEFPEALELGLRLLKEKDADMLLATDPDADRVAATVRTKQGYHSLTGNETGALLLDYLAASRRINGTMPENPVTVRSIVSTRMVDKIAENYGVEMITVLTGFKHIGDVLLGLERKNELNRFIFGFEESCGFLSAGAIVRDKDAVNTSLLLVEMASYYKLQGKTLADRLEELYQQYGIYRDTVSNFVFEGAEGMVKMGEIMDSLRKNPPAKIAGDSVEIITDYLNGTITKNGKTEAAKLPKSNVLIYTMEGGNTVAIRPSGTEPKIKTYCSLAGKTHAEADEIAARYTEGCKQLVK